MDYAASHVVYVDNRLSSQIDGCHLQRQPADSNGSVGDLSKHSRADGDVQSLEEILGEIEEIRLNLKSLLSVFDKVYPCISGSTCMNRISEIEHDLPDHQPLFVMVGVHIDEETGAAAEAEGEDVSSPEQSSLHSISLLRKISSRLSSSSLSKRVTPVAIIYDSDISPASNQIAGRSGSRPSSGAYNSKSGKSAHVDRKSAIKGIRLGPSQITQYLDVGAVEVLSSPLSQDRLNSLVSHAYHSYKEGVSEDAELLRRKKARKLSWLGNNDEKPYAYLREKMVSELMTGICNPQGQVHRIDVDTLPDFATSRKIDMRKAIATWGFSGHDFSEDELIYVAAYMLEHALKMPELEKWRISRSSIKEFLLASRAAYNSFVNYHNFRHVIDVMQAIFHFLVQIGTIPPFSVDSEQPAPSKTNISPIGALLTPFDALTLLITAIGHDVGHPGVNNAFLVSLNAPLAQLYNDRSVLEAFHCAAYSQILRRHWHAAFSDTAMRGLMINSILATDMGVHMKYMSELGNLQEKLHHNQGTDGWSASVLDDYRILACALLVKCADISNVARPFEVALQWADKLQLEFANQGTMEEELGIPTTLFGGPPELGNTIKLGKSQISFMNIFARPLFEAVTDILPDMAFAVEEMKRNSDIWSGKIKEAEESHDQRGPSIEHPDHTLSPRSLSPNRPSSRPDTSHPEGLPASDSSTGLAALSTNNIDMRRKSASAAHSQTLNLVADPARRASAGQAPALPASASQPTLSSSRRSSGALSTSNLPLSTIATRRASNGSPSQLQLGLDARSQTNSSATASENQQPTVHGSDDTLSQAKFAAGPAIAADDRQGSSYSNSTGGRRSSRKESAVDNIRSLQGSISHSSNRPYAHGGHHRSSSGAHTTNTNLSQSTPYSPTGTQATSVLSVDSEENKSHAQADGAPSPERRTFPKISSVDQHLQRSTGLDRTPEPEIKTSVITNGSPKDSLNGSYRSLGRKSSRFNFNFFKRRGKSVESTP